MLEQQALVATDLVVVDETSTNLDLTPRYARAPRGQPAIGVVPRNTPRNTTVIAAMTTAGMGAALILDGSADTLAFLAYVEQILVPTLRPGQVVLLDNLAAHHDPRVRAAIVACGCHLWFLPSYSPDLSPIELAFAKLKVALRQAGARTRAALEDAIAAALELITPDDARGFFQHCGYRSPVDWDRLLCTLL
jgi:transposase